MILCIDIGNTSSIFGIFKNDELISTFGLESKPGQSYDEYGVKLLELFKYNLLNKDEIEGIIISSVVPSLDLTYEKMFLKYFHQKPIFVGPGTKTGVKIAVDNPKQVGADIIVGIAAAIEKYEAPNIVIDMGTAITLFYVDSKKELIGGVISPGVKTSYEGLFKNTARLEEVKLNTPPSIIGKDTVSCIQSAMVYGTASMIDGIVRKMKQEIKKTKKEENLKVIITGGEAKFIKDYLEEDVIYDENLVLEGLNLIYKKN